MLTSRTKICLSISLVAMLVLEGTGAHAQSREYRRGYDQGYRDGANSGRGGDAANWHHRGGLEIESASYGSRGRRCDLRDMLRDRWRSSPVMNINVDNRLCGDPAPGDRKHLIVRYRCNGGPLLQENGQEGRTISLVCY